MNLQETIRQNRKVLFFLLRFFLVFGGLSLLYGVWIKSYGEAADPFSWFIGRNLQWINGQTAMQLRPVIAFPAIDIIYHGKQSVALFEGCNGIAVMILFFAFIIAFKGSLFHTIWFTMAGLLFIHMANLARLQLLVQLSNENSQLFHFMHKYLFTLFIYVAVFILWVIWVKWVNKQSSTAAEALVDSSVDSR